MQKDLDRPTPDLETLFGHMADAVYLIDPETSNIVWGNTQAWDSLGMSKADILDHSVLSLQKDVHGAPHWQEIADEIFKTDVFRFLGRHRHKDGYDIDVEVHTTHFQWQDKPYFLSIARDVSKRIQLESSSADDCSRELVALSESSDGVWDWSIAKGTVRFNPQMKRLLGYGPDEMKEILETWKDNVHPDDAPLVLSNLQEHLEGRRARYEATYRLKNRNGHYIWVQDRGRICEWDDEGTPVRAIGMLHDITDQKHLELSLQQQASRDLLTNLPNRREGVQQLQAQMSLARRLNTTLGIAYIDVDHFKHINDVYGHQAGDDTLKALADVLLNSLRSSDFVCRWGGEEFLALATDSSLDDMVNLGEKIRRAVQSTFLDGERPITISLGVTTSTGVEEISDVLVRADKAMYRAKHNGRNRVEFTDPVGHIDPVEI